MEDQKSKVIPRYVVSSRLAWRPETLLQKRWKGKMTLGCCIEVRKGLLGVGTSWKERHRSSNLAPEGWREGVELLRDSEQL